MEIMLKPIDALDMVQEQQDADRTPLQTLRILFVDKNTTSTVTTTLTRACKLLQKLPNQPQSQVGGRGQVKLYGIGRLSEDVRRLERTDAKTAISARPPGHPFFFLLSSVGYSSLCAHYTSSSSPTPQTTSNTVKMVAATVCD